MFDPDAPDSFATVTPDHAKWWLVHVMAGLVGLLPAVCLYDVLLFLQVQWIFLIHGGWTLILTFGETSFTMVRGGSHGDLLLSEVASIVTAGQMVLLAVVSLLSGYLLTLRISRLILRRAASR